MNKPVIFLCLGLVSILFAGFAIPVLHSAGTKPLRDSITVTIEGINLSEDMSTMSSKNDELLMLVYDYADTTKLTKPLLAEYFVLDSLHRTNKFTFFYKTPPAGKLLFFLIEIDTQKTEAEVEAMVRKQYRKIMALFTAKDMEGLRKCIGDEDIMGIKVIDSADLSGKYPFSFKGRYKLDKFHYALSLDNSL